MMIASTTRAPRAPRAALGAALTVALAVALAAGCAPPRASSSPGTLDPAAGAVPRGELPLEYGPRPTTAAITAADLMTRLYVFADDSMQGREAGTAGNVKGTEYLARELRRLGLQPAGEHGTYFQTIPFRLRTFDPATSLSVDGTALTMWADFAPLPSRQLTPPSLDGVPVIYGGAAADTGAGLTREQVAGKLVLLTVGDGPARTPQIPATSPLAAAAAIAVIGLEGVAPNILDIYRTTRQQVYGRPGREAPAAPQALYVSRRAAALLLGAPPESAAVGTAGRTVRGTIRYVEAGAPAQNVVAVLPGSDPALRGQYVAIGSHNDHVGFTRQAVDHDSLRAVLLAQRACELGGQPAMTCRQMSAAVNVDSLRRQRPARRDSINNGADDDGSGSVAMLEIAEAMAAARVKPKRSVLFVWHTAEEKGLLGAEYFTALPTVPRDSIVAQLNMDMVGRGGAADTPGGGPGYVMLVGSRRLSTELGDLVEAVNKARPAPLTFDYSWDADGHPERIYCRSDHYMYARYGIPVTFFTTGLHADYHRVTDEPQYIDYPHMAAVTQLVHDVALRVANLAHRPVVDKPKPADPNAPCRQ
jgi:hypothetical protein